MNSTPDLISKGRRVPTLDIARFYGMALVYYGHIIEQAMNMKNAVGMYQYKFIYSFHMPFFFLVAGYVAKPEILEMRPGAFLRRLFFTRLFPYLVFSVVFVVLHLLFKASYVATDPSNPTMLMVAAVKTLQGLPLFDIPLWFVTALVSVEVLHYLVGRFLTTDTRIVIAALCCYFGGYYLNQTYQFVQFQQLFNYTLWFANEAPVMYAFYLTGILLRRNGVFTRITGKDREFTGRTWTIFGGGLLCLLAVYLTYDLNTGPFRMFDAVVILLSSHGNVLLFPFTAIAGCFMLLLLAHASRENRLLSYLGRNVFILLILNGVFYHFLNVPFMKWLLEKAPDSALAITGGTAAFTLLSLLLCVPVIHLLHIWLPQLVGRPRTRGPLLPRLLR